MATIRASIILTVPLALGQDTPGFQFLGYGYDALRGNPLDTSGLGDRGYRTNIFTFSHKSGHRTPDKKWAVPDKTTAQAMSSCSLEQTTHVINSAYSYQKTVSDSVDVSGKYEEVQGDFSVESKHIQQTTSDKKSIFAHITSLCSVYKLTMHTFDHPPVDHNFAKAVSKLPLHYSESTYMDFIKAFGTHVVDSMTLGGRWGWQMEFKLDDWQSMLNYQIDIKGSLDYAGKKKAGIKADHSVDSKVQSHVVNSISANKSFNIGGSFKPDVHEWQKSVAAKPMPVATSLTRISALLTKDYLPSEHTDDLKTKKTNLDTALEHYCSYLSKNVDHSVSCDPRKPIPLPSPKPVNTIRGVCINNGGGYTMSFKMYAAGTPKSKGSGSFPIGKTRCIEALDIDAKDGDTLKCQMHANAGKTRDCPGNGFKYSWFSKLHAHYHCSGTTLAPKCEFTGLSEGTMLVENANQTRANHEIIVI